MHRAKKESRSLRSRPLTPALSHEGRGGFVRRRKQLAEVAPTALSTVPVTFTSEYSLSSIYRRYRSQRLEHIFICFTRLKLA